MLDLSNKNDLLGHQKIIDGLIEFLVLQTRHQPQILDIYCNDQHYDVIDHSYDELLVIDEKVLAIASTTSVADSRFGPQSVLPELFIQHRTR